MNRALIVNSKGVWCAGTKNLFNLDAAIQGGASVSKTLNTAGGTLLFLLCEDSPNVPDQPVATAQTDQPAEPERGSVASDGSPLSAPKSNASAVPCYTDQMLRELQVASRPLMDFLMKYHNPHVKAIVETHHVEVVEGLATEQRVEMDHHE